MRVRTKEMKEYWELHLGPEYKFRQADYIKNSKDSGFLYKDGGMCFGICLEAFRRVGLGSVESPFSPEKALINTIEKLGKSNSTDARDKEKARRLATRIYVQQNFLQDYLKFKVHNMDPLAQVPVLESNLKAILNENGGAMQVSLGNQHAIYILKSDTGPEKYRVFDPNIGASKALPVGEICEHVQQISDFYGFGRAKFEPSLLNLKNNEAVKKLKFLFAEKKRGYAKPGHIIELIEGHLSEDKKRIFTKEKLFEDLSSDYVLNIAQQYISNNNTLDRYEARKRLKEAGFCEEELKECKLSIENIFFWAVARERIDVMNILVKEIKVEINEVNVAQDMLFHNAAFSGVIKSMSFLIDHGADINKVDGRGRKPIFYAALDGRLEALRFLMQQGADVMQVNGEQGLLHCSAQFFSFKVVEELLKYELIDVFAKDKDGKTAFEVAKSQEIKDLIKASMLEKQRSRSISERILDGRSSPQKSDPRKGGIDI